MTDNLTKAKQYLTPGAFVPVDMEITALLLEALRQALEKKEGNEMTDNQLINEVAELWVANGGDAEGIAWCWQRIQQAVEQKMIEDQND